ncbi:MAG: hypothetical protein QOK10_2186 [Pseudonocardiales bacterium]|nr:hypothetical protein [Pseudonocardiales bacterium]
MDTGLADDGALLGACPSQSPVDGRLLDQLSSGDIARMDAQSRVTVLLALERERSRIDALRQEVLSAIAVNDLSAQQWCREEIGAALRLSPVTAHARLKDAEQLVTRLPEVHQALRDGRICELQARAITEASYRLPEEAYPALQERALRRADEQSLQQTRQVLRRAVISLDPHGTQRRHLNAVADRRVRISDAEDGMAWLSVLLPALHALACYNRLDQQARAERTGEDGSGDDGMACDRRTLDQLRADHSSLRCSAKRQQLPTREPAARTSASSYRQPPCSARTTNRAGWTATVRSPPIPRGQWRTTPPGRGAG